MPIQAVCPHCDHKYTLADSAAGKKLRCKECKEPFDAVPVRAAPASTVPARSRPQRPAPEPEEVDPEEVEPRPRRRRPQKARGGMPLWVWLLLGGGGLAFLGVVGLVALLLLLPGSGFSLVNRVTRENYDKLQPGMSEKELVEILGTPSERINLAEQDTGLPPGWKLSELERQLLADVRVLKWNRGSDYIEAVMQHDSAVRFTGHWEGVGTFSHGFGNVGPPR